MFVLPVVVFSAEYALVPIPSAAAFYGRVSGFFDYTGIGWIYHSSGNPRFTYYAIYVVSIPFLYLANVAIAVPYFAASRNIGEVMSKQDSALKWAGNPPRK